MKAKVDLRELKSKHRLELVMKDTGETFDESGPVWKSAQTTGLLVDLEKQSWRVKDGAGGDVFEWLKYRYGWPFVMCLRYMQSRKADGYSVATVEAVRPVDKKPPVRVDFAKDEPADRWQKKALELAGDRIRPFFSPYVTAGEIVRALSSLPSRYLPMADFMVHECRDCGYGFDWTKPGEIGYLEERYHYNGEEIPLEERTIFFLDNSNLSDLICESCKQKEALYHLALDYCLRSAHKRQEDALEKNKQEKRRLEDIARHGLVRAHVSQDEFDIEYLFNRAVDWESLAAADATDDQIARTFSQRLVYEFLASGEEQSPATWARVIGAQV